MMHSVTVSDSLYRWLQAEVEKRRLNSIEELLEVWRTTNEMTRQRQLVVTRIDSIREQLLARYGEMPDSTSLLRDDRDR